MQKILKGNQIQLFYQGRTFAFATAHTLTVTGNTSDIASKDHGGWGASSVSNLSWEVTGEYFYTDASYDTLFDIMLYKRPILVQIAEVKNYSENGLVDLGGDVEEWVPSPKYKQGYATITSLTLNANTGEKASYSLTLMGSGPLVSVDNTKTQYYIDIYYGTSLQSGAQLFDTSHQQYINSVWAYSNEHPESEQPEEIEISVKDGKLVSADEIKDMISPIIRIYLPNKKIPDYLFYQNPNIYRVDFNNNIDFIGEYAFAESSIVVLYTGDSAEMDYANHCFAGCVHLNTINRSQGVPSPNLLNAINIGNSAFEGCVGLESLEVGNSCKTIFMFSFKDCDGINTVYLGRSLEIVGAYAFPKESDYNIDFHFYTDKAPVYDTNYPPFGNIGHQTFYLHNADSVSSWRANVTGWGPDSYYNDANYVIVNT